VFFRFPPDARWNPERSVVEFGIGVDEYEGVVRVTWIGQSAGDRPATILLRSSFAPASAGQTYP
jgi:hypothetical protein